MQQLHPLPAEQLAFGDTGVVRPLSAEVVAGAIRRGAPDELRERLGQSVPALLTRAQAILGAFAGGAPRANEQRGKKEDSQMDQIVNAK